jgi:hypothetical protein
MAQRSSSWTATFKQLGAGRRLNRVGTAVCRKRGVRLRGAAREDVERAIDGDFKVSSARGVVGIQLRQAHDDLGMN